ncbi:FtsK/SpoIIIE domain-containing protein, partial [Clostridium perfringens]|nr:FtsK/SpoIIIE domain-containing protein [Clostridium perfringens]
ERRLEPAWIDLFGNDPHLLCFGDAESGKTSLLRCIALGLGAAFGPDEVRLHLADVRRGLADLANDPHVASYAASGPALEQTARELAAQLAGAASAT